MEPNRNTFCTSPFIHQSTKTDGSIKACCRSLPAISNIKDETLAQAWNNPELKQLRLDLLNGVRNKRCDVCWKLEDADVISLRQKYNMNDFDMQKAIQAAETMSDDGTVHNKPTWIEFKMSNLCNLRCRMCHPMDSTKWYRDYKSVEHLHDSAWQSHMKRIGLSENSRLINYDDDFFEELPNFMEDINLLAFAGGEPLMDENHYRVLDSVVDRAHEIKLRYATNITMLSAGKYNALDYWPKFKEIHLACSLDGPPGLNEYIRGDANISKIEQNIKKAIEIQNIRVTGKLTVQALNIFYVPEALEWFRKLGVRNADMHFVTWPDHLDARIWQGEARTQIIEKLTAYIESLKDDEKKIRTIAKNILKYFMSNDMYSREKFNKFVEWNLILDARRNETYMDYDFLKRFMIYHE